MSGSYKIGIKQFQTLKKAEPFDLFVADHAWVWRPSAKIVSMKIVNDIIAKFTAEVQTENRNLKIWMVAYNQWRWLKRGALVK